MNEVSASPTGPSRAAQLFGLALAPLLLLTAVGTLQLLLQAPGALFGWVFAGVGLAAVAWIGVSVFWPARAERNCPICSERGLERLDPERTLGLHCTACGWADEEASSWLFAEDEDVSVQELVVSQRQEQRRERRARARVGLGADSIAASDERSR